MKDAEPKAVTIRLRSTRRHEAQHAFVYCNAKRIVIRAGRRGGKTTGVARLAIDRFLDGHRVLYAAPVATQIDAFWSEIVRGLGPAIDAGIYTKNQTEHRIRSGRSTQSIRAKTAWNADTLRGDYADVLILDEWQLMDETAWEEVGAPMLLDNDGDAIFVYTPPSLHSRSATKARDPRHAAKLFDAAAKDKTGRWAAVHFASHQNPHISRAALKEITRDMTSLAYRQEILAEDIAEIPGALWGRGLIEKSRIAQAPDELVRVVVGVDPSGSSTTEAGIVACGIDAQGIGYVLTDSSLAAPSPHVWASAAVNLYHALRADRIIGERNFGGDMVSETIHTVDPTVSYQDTVSSRAKIVRAEPIAALFEVGRVKMCGSFPDLEDEMTSYVAGAARSPNRMDAMVFALSVLMLGPTFGIRDYYQQQAAAAEKVVALQNTPAPWSNEDRCALTRSHWRSVMADRGIVQ